MEQPQIKKSRIKLSKGFIITLIIIFIVFLAGYTKYVILYDSDLDLNESFCEILPSVLCDKFPTCLSGYGSSSCTNNFCTMDRVYKGCGKRNP
jgi:hypothetical protein